MIQANFKCSRKKLIGFSVSGHSGYDDEGFDIVCASVSSAVMLVCNAITEVYKLPADINVGDNVISCEISSDDTLLIDALKLHLSALAEDYPENISVTISEV